MTINPTLVGMGLQETAARMNLPSHRARQRQSQRGRGGSLEFPLRDGDDFLLPGETQQQRRTTFPGEAPTLPELPTFVAPEARPGELAGETQRLAAPQIRSLRDITAAAISSAAGQPANIRKMTIRQALQGFGGGLESVISGARRGAQQVVQARLGRETQAAQFNFQANVNALMNQYSNQWRQFLSGGITTTTQRTGPPMQDVVTGTPGGGFRVDQPSIPRLPPLVQEDITKGERFARDPSRFQAFS